MVYTTAQCVVGDDYVINVTSDIQISGSPIIAPSITATIVPYTPNIVGTIPMFRQGATVIYKLQVYRTGAPVMNSPIVVVAAGDIPSSK